IGVGKCFILKMQKTDIHKYDLHEIKNKSHWFRSVLMNLYFRTSSVNLQGLSWGAIRAWYTQQEQKKVFIARQQLQKNLPDHAAPILIDLCLYAQKTHPVCHTSVTKKQNYRSLKARFGADVLHFKVRIGAYTMVPAMLSPSGVEPTMEDIISGQVDVGYIRIVHEKASEELSFMILPQFLPPGSYLTVSRLVSMINHTLLSFEFVIDTF
ncbi:hypothetical protein STEG23_001376, partial [Scotinomys teguina]